MERASVVRLLRALEETREKLHLSLDGMNVITELASGAFMSSALLASLCGGDVLAIGQDSIHGSFEAIRRSVLRIANKLGVANRIHVAPSGALDTAGSFDLFLNLGHVRPINSGLLRYASERAVVSYMCENWEERPGDVDFAACSKAAVPVYFTDEDAWGMNTFQMVGYLAMKLLLDAGAEIAHMSISILSSDKFGPAIMNTFRSSTAMVDVFSGPDYAGWKRMKWDAVIVAEYSAVHPVLGSRIALDEVRCGLKPGGFIVQLAGINCVNELLQAGYAVFPSCQLERYRMSYTLAHLGIVPVVRLIGSGLKVGWAACRGRDLGLKGEELNQYVLSESPAQLRVRSPQGGR